MKRKQQSWMRRRRKKKKKSDLLTLELCLLLKLIAVCVDLLKLMLM
jgi:hypothetical protein